MKDKFIKFIKNKFNIALIAIQVISIVFYAMSGIAAFFSVLFFAGEGLFFIVWGVKILVEIKNNSASQEIYKQLPFSEKERAEISARNLKIQKNNKFLAIILIILGVSLFFSLISLIF